VKQYWQYILRWEVLIFGALALYPLFCALIAAISPDGAGSNFGSELGDQFSTLFVFGMLALALNTAVGYAGLLQLGIAAFFAIGVYVTGICTINSYPFQVGLTVAGILSILIAALFGLLLGAPSLRLRGDYLAIVTLGFGEIVKSVLINMDQITKGTQGLNPIPSPSPPAWLLSIFGMDPHAASFDYRVFYYLALALLLAVTILLVWLERSRFGRAWIALREDQLAASCMGISIPRVKIRAFVVSAAIAGLAGCLYSIKQRGTSDPNEYGFSLSITMLCCVILGGLGSIRGTLLGVFVLMGFDKILSPILNSWVQDRLSDLEAGGTTLPQWADRFLSFANWRLMIFGLALILVMRFRPEGLWPSARLQHELHEQKR
jgi:branched-chain amino acid transport system permease protein